MAVLPPSPVYDTCIVPTGMELHNTYHGSAICCTYYSSSKSSILQILETGLSITQPDHIYDTMVKIFKHSIDAWRTDKGE